MKQFHLIYGEEGEVTLGGGQRCASVYWQVWFNQHAKVRSPSSLWNTRIKAISGEFVFKSSD